MNLSDAQALDRADPLAPLRDRFDLPEGTIYLDGNSLGALPRAVASRVAETLTQQWGVGLITSWNVHDWIDMPATTGDKIARLIGAPPGSVIAGDTTSINIFKVLGAALRLRPDRKVIVTEAGNFPTDIYMAESLARLMGQGHIVRQVEAEALDGAIDETVAVILLTEVNYRTGSKLDMVALTARAHEAGALIIWDLAHSAGTLPVALEAVGADFAVGCGYKYLNGGPGAPAFAYVAPQHQAQADQPLAGWLGHAAPFEFASDYRPAAGPNRFRTGTPPIIAMAALDTALDVFEGVELPALKKKADALFDLFADEVGARCPDLELLTPRDPSKRGTQVSLRHAEGYAIMQALIAHSVIGDFRQPDIMRFGLTPLYLRFEDVFRAAEILAEVMATRAWDRPEFKRKAKVV